jgi:hypothetical protein
MISSNTQKMVVALIVVLLLVVFGYIVFNGTPDTSTTTPKSTVGTAGQDVLALVEKLRTISIDQKIFTSPLLNNLKDFSVPITPEQQGRQNPFASIGSDFGSTVPSQPPASGTKSTTGQ